MFTRTIATVSIALTCTLAAARGADPATQTAAPSTQPAGRVQTCIETAADLSPVYPTTHFPAGTKELFLSLDLTQGKVPKKVTSTWVVVDVGAVAPPNYQMAKADMSLAGAGERARFKYSQPKALPPGKYRVDVTGDDRTFGSVDFDVSAEKPAPPEVKDAKQLLPLTPGRVWTYDFAQQAGGDAKIVLEDAAQTPDGKFHAEVTMTVAGDDDKGTRMELRRNGKLVFQEWMKLDKNGLSSTQRKAGDDDPVAVDPPQLLWKFPLKPHTWDYHPKDKSYAQKYLMWGPLPVHAPQGEVPGYVVLCTQAGAPGLSAERHWVPGLGMVKEIIVTAVGDKMVSRQEMVLKSVK